MKGVLLAIGFDPMAGTVYDVCNQAVWQPRGSKRMNHELTPARTQNGATCSASRPASRHCHLGEGRGFYGMSND